MFEVKHRWLGTILFAVEADSLRRALELAVQQRADLRGADLGEANLRGADLRQANLVEANLGEANLGEAKNAETAILETGETLATFRDAVVPELIAAGGHEVPVAAWTCHSWENCPMAHAFGVHQIEDIPLLYRPRVEQFIRLFDAGLIPAPETEAQQG